MKRFKPSFPKKKQTQPPRKVPQLNNLPALVVETIFDFLDQKALNNVCFVFSSSKSCIFSDYTWRSLLVKCQINQRYANPKAALYNYFQKKMIKKKKKVSDIYSFNPYDRYKKIIERFDLAFHFFVNSDRFHITTPIFNEESLQFKLMLPIEPFSLRSLYKITLILSSDYFQTSYEIAIFTRSHQNLKSFPIYDPENPVTSFYELPFYSHPNSYGLYGLYEPDVICYCLFVINYLDIIKTFDPSVIEIPHPLVLSIQNDLFDVTLTMRTAKNVYYHIILSSKKFVREGGIYRMCLIEDGYDYSDMRNKLNFTYQSSLERGRIRNYTLIDFIVISDYSSALLTYISHGMKFMGRRGYYESSMDGMSERLIGVIEYENWVLRIIVKVSESDLYISEGDLIFR